MAEKRENSVLFSLRELRQIEDDRIKQEDDEARARAEAERQAREDAARRAREEEERRIREAQEAERRSREEQERRVREDQLRLEEAERRARIEAQTRLEEQRLKMVVEAEAIHGAKKKPVALIVAMVVLLLGASGLGVYMYMDAQDAKAKQAALEAENAELQRNIDDALRVSTQKDQEYAVLLDQYQKAATEQDRQRILAELEAKKREKEAANANLNKLRERQSSKGKAKPSPKPTGPKCAKDDPLCGT